MTLSSTTVKEQYAGDGATVEFAIPFVFWNSDEVRVVLTDAVGEETVWTEGTQYTVSGGDGSAGEITVETAPTDYTPGVGQRLTIKSNLPDTQGTDLVVGGVFNSEAVEERLDKNVRLTQQQAEEISRSPKLAEGTTSATPTFPEPSADSFIGWNAAGTDLANKSLGDLSLSFDTVFTDLSEGDFLAYDGTNWVNQAANNAAAGVRVVSASNLDLSADLAAGETVDGITLVAGDLVLVTGQSTTSQNGIYEVPSSGAASRDANFSTYDSLAGILVLVQEGDDNADSLWIGASDKGGNLGSTALSFTPFTGQTTFTSLEINDTSADHQYVFAVNELAADRTITLPLLTGNDTFVFEDHTQTLSNKTLASPTVTGTLTGPSGTWDSGGVDIAANDSYAINGTDIVSDSAGTATLSNIDALDATTEETVEQAIDALPNLATIQGHTFTLTGDLVRSGNDSLTLTTTGATNVTLPTSGTLATLADLTAEDLDFAGDSGTGAVDLDSQSLTIATDNDSLVTAAANQTLTISLADVLEDIDTLGPNSTDGEFLVGTGAGALAWEAGETARASIGIETGATDNALLRADGVGGSTLQASGVTLDDSDEMSGATIDSANNTLTLDLAEGTLTGTKSEFNTALSDDAFAYIGTANVFTQSQRVSSASPTIYWNRTDAGADEKLWASFVRNAGEFALQAVNDAENAATDAIAISRTGTTIDDIQLDATAITLNGVVGGTAVGISDNDVLTVDGSPNDDEYARFTANGIEGRTAAEARSDLGLANEAIEFVIDGGGNTITTGIKGDLEIPYACTIQRATALADQSGSIVVDIWVDTYANFPPTDADSITASAPVTISTDTDSQDSTLTGWTTSLAAGSIIRFNVDSVTDIERCTVSLLVNRS